MMLKYVLNAIIIACSFVVSISAVEASNKHSATDAQVKKAIIKESIEQYPGNCPCPYNVARNGSRCGKRSAYSKRGGYAPICYSSDVTQEMIMEWSNRHSDR